MRSRSRQLEQNAEAALISAIEIYNKPNFAYREETFAILALNAWELLLKARLLSLNRNSLKCLCVYEQRRNKAGKVLTKKYVKKNRAGNAFTIGLDKAIVALDGSSSPVSEGVKKNLHALTEIRDNAVHFVNAGPKLAKQVLEIGTACVLNFMEAAKKWFKLDLSRYHLYLLPIGFVQSPGAATAVASSPDAKNLLKYLSTLVAEAQTQPDDRYHVALEVNLSFQRSSGNAAIALAITNDPTAPKVQLSEADIRQRYPWDYSTLIGKMKERYVDFGPKRKFHELRKPLLDDAQYVHKRYLDPHNEHSSCKIFYNPNILQFFDVHYTQK